MSKNITILILCFISVVEQLNSQNKSKIVKFNYLSLSVGSVMGERIKPDFYLLNSYENKFDESLSLGVKYERELKVVNRRINFEVALLHQSASGGFSVNKSTNNGPNTNYNVNYKLNNISLFSSAKLLFGSSKKIDYYIKLGVLFNYGRWKISDTNPNKEDPYLILKDNISTPISENIQIGLKYKFNDKLGLYIEVGSSACLIQSGVSLRF